MRVLPWRSFTGTWLESRQFSYNLGTDLNGVAYCRYDLVTPREIRLAAQNEVGA